MEKWSIKITPENYQEIGAFFDKSSNGSTYNAPC